MRILHTADWHLGKKLDFYSRLEEQKAVLEEITSIAKKLKVDLVLIAGDLFDTFNPPNEATELLYKTLKRLSQNGKVPVIAIAGNHDSPDRVNVADVLARENGIIFIGHPTDEVPLFELDNGFKVQKSEVGFIEIALPQFSYPVRILHTAFANEVRLKEYFGEEKQQSLQESLKNKWGNLAKKYGDENGVNILTTHLYLAKPGNQKPEEPEGEKPLNIGNADVIYTDAIPPAIQYAALGHLHRYQDVGVHQPVVYSSAPLSYSFSEAGQQKYVVVIDVEPGKEAEVERIPLQSGKKLHRKTFDDVDRAIDWLLENKDSLVELTLATEDFLKADERKRLSQAHNGIIHLIPKVKSDSTTADNDSEINLNQDITSLFKDYFKSKTGQTANKEMMNLFEEIKNA